MARKKKKGEFQREYIVRKKWTSCIDSYSQDGGNPRKTKDPQILASYTRTMGVQLRREY